MITASSAAREGPTRNHDRASVPATATALRALRLNWLRMELSSRGSGVPDGCGDTSDKQDYSYPLPLMALDTERAPDCYSTRRPQATRIREQIQCVPAHWPIQELEGTTRPSFDGHPSRVAQPVRRLRTALCSGPSTYRQRTQLANPIPMRIAVTPSLTLAGAIREKACSRSAGAANTAGK